MKFLLIPDKFKGSLTSEEVSKGFIAGIKESGINATFTYIKASDGGDGFMDAISTYKRCVAVEVISQDPLGKTITAHYLYNKENESAYIEMAKASGMQLLKTEERNPMLTSTYGTGLLIRDAIEKGIKRIYIGIGGSATTDGGIGIANALGYSFLDDKGKALEPIGANLTRITKIDDSGVTPLLKEISCLAVNDVSNPLFGKNGAAHVYGGQKGATEAMINELDTGLKNLDAVVRTYFNKEYAKLEGSGAAGGTAYGLKCFLNAEYLSGVDFVLDVSGVRQLLEKENFDYLVTGEGKIDDQTLFGKLIHGVLTLGKEYNIPVLAVCGKLDISLAKLKKEGIEGIIEIQESNENLEYNMRNAKELLVAKTAAYFQING